MLNMEPQPDILNLLSQLQESTTEDVDEERGSFKKGDKVTYDMFGGSLTNSDLILTLGVDEHTMRAIHNEALAEIVEAVGEEVARYRIMFEDGFVINDVAVSELKSVDEQVEEFKSGDKVEALGDTYEIVSVGMENLIVKDSHGEETTIKKSDVAESKTNEAEEGDMTFEEIKAEVITAVKNMRKHTNEWGVRDSLKKFTSWGFWKKGDMASIDVEIANDIADELLDYIQTALEQDIEDAYDIVQHYVSLTYESKTNEQKLSVADVKKLFKSIDKAFAKHLTGMTRSKKDAIKMGQEVGLELSDEGKKVLEESKTNEAEEATQTMQPQEKPNINAEDYHMEDYSEEELNKPEVKVKSKSEETGNAIRQVEDDELEQKEDKVVTPKKESKLKEQEDEEKKVAVSKGDCPECGKVQGQYHELGCSRAKNESKLKEDETEFTPSRSEVSKISYEKLRKLHKNALRYLKYWEKDGTVPEKVETMRKSVERYEEMMAAKDLMSKDDSSEKKESKFSFMKKQDPLWLCSECYKTFRANKAVCENCKSENVERITEQYGPGFTKEVFDVTWKNTDTGKEESTRVMAFDKADAKKEAKRPNREVTKVEGPIKSVPEKEETKVPFDENSEGSKLRETVEQLVREVPGIDKEEQEVLLKAIEDGTISNEWPSDEQMIDALAKADIDSAIVDDPDVEDFRVVYLKHILLTHALKATRVAKESKMDEQEEGIPEKGQTYQIHRKLGIGLPDGTYEVTNVEYRKTMGDLAKQFQVADDDKWWVAKFYSFKEVASESKVKEQKIPTYIQKGSTLVSKSGHKLEITGIWIDHFHTDPEVVVEYYYETADGEKGEERNSLSTFRKMLDEAKVNEQEEDWDITFLHKHNLIWHNPMVDRDGEYYHWQKSPIKGKRIRVFTDYQAEWVERNDGIPVKVDYESLPEDKEKKYPSHKAGEMWKSASEVICPKCSSGGARNVENNIFECNKCGARWDEGTGEVLEAKKEIIPSTAIEIVRSQIDSDAYNIRVVELPEGSIVILDSVSDREEALRRGKEFAGQLNAKFLGIIDEKKIVEMKCPKCGAEMMEEEDIEGFACAECGHVEESKLKEQEEDTFKTVVKGIVAKTLADEIAAKENGQVVQDEDDEKKFMIIVKEE